jgi:hypothetical protein
VRSEATQFKRGHPSGGGRRKGSRDKIATSLLEGIAKDFGQHGEEAIKICRIERPTEYLKIVASLLPKELEATIDGNVEVTHQIEHIRRTIIDPKVITVQHLLPKVEPEADLGTLKADLGGLYE